MKTIKDALLLVLALILFAGCGDEKPSNYTLDGEQIPDGPLVYTLEDAYMFDFQGAQVVIYGFEKAWGETNEDASALLVGPYQYCGIRMLVKKEEGLNDYSIRIGASDWAQPGCGDLRGDYNLYLTGPETATIQKTGESDETF